MGDLVQDEIYRKLQNGTLSSLSDLEKLQKSPTIKDGLQNSLQQGQNKAHDATQQIENVANQYVPEADQWIDTARHTINGVSAGIERGNLTIDINTNSTIAADPQTLDTVQQAKTLAETVTDPEYVGDVTGQAVEQGLNQAANMTGIHNRTDLLNLVTEGTAQASYHGGREVVRGGLDALGQVLYDRKEEILLLVAFGWLGRKTYKAKRDLYRRCNEDRKALDDAYHAFVAENNTYERDVKVVGRNTLVDVAEKDEILFSAQFAAYAPQPSMFEKLRYTSEQSAITRQHTKILETRAKYLAIHNEKTHKDPPVNQPIKVDVVTSK
jgi:hypothetical protein